MADPGVPCPECQGIQEFNEAYRQAGQNLAVSGLKGSPLAPVPGAGASDQALKNYSYYQSLQTGPTPQMQVAAGSNAPPGASSMKAQQEGLPRIPELDQHRPTEATVRGRCAGWSNTLHTEQLF